MFCDGGGAHKRHAFDVGVTRILYASPTAELRLTFSGEMPEIPALQYRLSGDYAFTTTNPYAVNVGSADRNLTQLVPASRAQLLLGLQYQF